MSNTEVTIPNNAQELMFNIPAMGQMQVLAEYMASGKATIPAEFQGNVGDCMAVCMQAALWKMNPYALIQKVFIVHGKIGYEGQAVNAAITTSGAIVGRPKFEYFGPWEKIRGNFKMQTQQGKKPLPVPNWKPEDEEGVGVTVVALLEGEDEPTRMDVYLKQCQPRNSTLWPTDPEQQISYTAIRKFARRNCPEVIMGVYADDEISEADMREINSPPGKEPAESRSFANAAPANEPDPAEVIKSIKKTTSLGSLEKLLPECQKFTQGTEQYKKVKKAYSDQKKELQKPIEPEADFKIPAADILSAIKSSLTVDDLNEVEPHIMEYKGTDEFDDLMKSLITEREKLESES